MCPTRKHFCVHSKKTFPCTTLKNPLVGLLVGLLVGWLILMPRTQMPRTPSSPLHPGPQTPLLQAPPAPVPLASDTPALDTLPRTIQDIALFFPLPTLFAAASQDVHRTLYVCCDDIFNDENAQRPSQFHERPRKLEKQNKKRVGRGKKSAKILAPGPPPNHTPTYPNPPCGRKRFFFECRIRKGYFRVETRVLSRWKGRSWL